MPSGEADLSFCFFGPVQMADEEREDKGPSPHITGLGSPHVGGELPESLNSKFNSFLGILVLSELC